MSAPPLLSVQGLRKAFGGVQAVQDVSLQLAEGELLALIGPNGAGKSTTFNMVGGQLVPDAGRVLLAGQDITGVPPRRLARLGVGRTFQIAETFASLTVLQNVQAALLAQARATARWWQRADAHQPAEALQLLAQVGLQEQAARPCSELAYGDVKRLELAQALAGQPRLLLMDEPTAGMAPAERVALMQLVRDLARARRMGVLFTEHSMDVVFGQADRVAVLVRGQLLAEGPPREIQADARVQQAYLGGGFGEALGREGAPGSTALAGPHPASSLLNVQDLHAWYGAAHILQGVSLAVAPGEVVALMGRNGAGKSTTLKSIAGLLARTAGRVEFMGASLLGWPAHRIARAGLGYVPEERRIFTDLTVLENLDVGRQPPRRRPDGRPLAPWTPERLLALFPNLAEMPHRPGGRMSGGEQQMLTVARTLMGQPLLVLLDEPSEGVAPLVVQQMARAIAELKQQGLGILLCEQNLPFAAAVADRACVLEQGRIVHEAPMAQLVADEAARRRYLGV
ncbi:ATP-binding cassette domain-containing protein [Melaminivora sp.]|uniref:ATP-binding cassette domain-containing protein n=1 Tax=Melaminivora sp. TaxID=1933032 RepID=UPI0028B1B848|nr:ATP-binding cassette domain-containing protein [Melaminivora sp.]